MHNITGADYHYHLCDRYHTERQASHLEKHVPARSLATSVSTTWIEIHKEADTVNMHFRPATTLQPSQTHVQTRAITGTASLPWPPDLAVFYGAESTAQPIPANTRQTGCTASTATGGDLPTSKSRRSEH
jgi:hypothetical protein